MKAKKNIYNIWKRRENYRKLKNWAGYSCYTINHLEMADKTRLDSRSSERGRVKDGW